MGQSLVNATQQSPLSARLRNKQVLGKLGVFTVPAGVENIWYTGVAAGARCDQTTPLAPYVNWAGSYNYSFGVSPSGEYIFATSYYAGGTSSAPRIDPLGKKASLTGISTAIASGSGGQEAYAADNGFLISSSANAPSPNYSSDGGKTWSATGVAAYGTGQATIAMMPVASRTTPVSDTRWAYVQSSNTNIQIYNGTTGQQTTYAGKSFSSMSYANGNFIAGESNATTKTSIYFCPKSIADAGGNWSAGWTSAVVDAVNNNRIWGVTYGAGLYVAHGNGGCIYTAASLTGPWTARTSNTANAIYGMKYAGGRFVGVCAAGDIVTSTDGIAWSKTAAVGSATDRYRNDLSYSDLTGHWVVSFENAVGSYFSTDGTTWTAFPSSASIAGVQATPFGIVGVVSQNSVIVVPDPSKANYSTCSTSGDGGDNRVVRASSQAELLLLAGGKSAPSIAYSNGGTSEGVHIAGGGAGLGAMGPGGQAATFGNLLGSGMGMTFGAASSSNAVMGGPVVQLKDLLNNDGMSGIKIPGGSGGYPYSGQNNSGGGGSIMAITGAGVSACGWGAGQASTESNRQAGGGGEGIVRFKIPVTPGETLLYTSGMPVTTTGSPENSGVYGTPQFGFSMIEWE